MEKIADRHHGGAAITKTLHRDGRIFIAEGISDRGEDARTGLKFAELVQHEKRRNSGDAIALLTFGRAEAHPWFEQTFAREFILIRGGGTMFGQAIKVKR